MLKLSKKITCAMVAAALVATSAGIVAFSAQPAWANDVIADLQETIDAADSEIQSIVQQLSTPGLSAKTITELNRRLENQEWVKSQAQYAIYREQEAQRAEEDRIRIEAEEFVNAVAAFVSMGETLDIDIDNFNSEVSQYKAAQDRFESGTWNQAEFDRLNQWYYSLKHREERLDSRIAYRESRRSELKIWGESLDIWP